MKLKVIFLRKKQIYLAALFILIILFAICYKMSKNPSQTFSNNTSDLKVIKSDLNGDGDQDNLNVNINNNKYYIEVKTKDKNFALEPNKPVNTFGSFSNTWPMRITLLDVSRDRIPEIFIQSSDKNMALQHVFVWNGEKFENAFSNSNNIIGFIDHKNSKTPKVVSGRITENNIVFSNYIFLNYKFKNYNYDFENTFMGKDTVLALINYLQSLPGGEAGKPNEIFSKDISSSNFDLITKMSTENNTYTFQDGIFMDTKSNKDGETSELEWTLNFKGVSNTTKDLCKNYTLVLKLKGENDSKNKYYFKITSLTLNSNK